MSLYECRMAGTYVHGYGDQLTVISKGLEELSSQKINLLINCNEVAFSSKFDLARNRLELSYSLFTPRLQALCAYTVCICTKSINF